MLKSKYVAGLCLATLLVMAVTGRTAAQAQDLEPYRDWFGSYGYVDSTGNIVINCQFDDAKEFSEGRAAVLSRGGDISGGSVFGQLSLTLKWGYIDTSGMTVIPCVYDYAGQFSDGYAAVMSGNKWGFVDYEGDTLVSYRYNEVHRFVNGYAAVRMGDRWGYIDSDGNELVPCMYDVASDFGTDGFAAVSRADSSGFVYRDGNWYASKDRALNWIRGIPFSVYAKDKVMNRMNEWQLIEPGETVPDWEARVNEESFMARLEGLEMRYEAEYIEANRLEDPELLFGPYDSLSEAFPVEIVDHVVHDTDSAGAPERLRTFHIDLAVPVQDAGAVSGNWKRARGEYTYFVDGDRIALADVELTLPGRRVYEWTNPAYSPKRRMLLDYDLEEIDFTLPGKIYRQEVKALQDSAAVDTDTDIPGSGKRTNDNMYAVVIANQSYTTGMTVPYALNDGEVFKEYCVSRLRVPEDNVFYLTDADAAKMSAVLLWIDRMSDEFSSDTRVVLYFSGQCLLDEGVGETYLLPVDYASTGVQSGLRLSELYSRLSRSGIDDAIFLVDASYGKISRNGMRIAVFDDGDIEESWLQPSDRMVVFYAAGEKDGAYPYPEKRHGLFTYFLMKALQDRPEVISYGDLFDYISDNVERVSVQLYGRKQTPEVYSSKWDGEAWREFVM